MKTGKQLGLTLAECQELMQGNVYQYRKAGEDIYNNGYYTRGRTMNSRPHDGGHRGNVDIYIINENKEITTLCYDTTAHRSNVILSAFLSNKLKNINYTIIGNYITNGYSTRLGLFFSYSEKQIEKMEKISNSHTDYIGQETNNSSRDHYNRMTMR